MPCLLATESSVEICHSDTRSNQSHSIWLKREAGEGERGEGKWDDYWEWTFSDPVESIRNVVGGGGEVGGGGGRGKYVTVRHQVKPAPFNATDPVAPTKQTQSSKERNSPSFWQCFRNVANLPRSHSNYLISSRLWIDSAEPFNRKMATT